MPKTLCGLNTEDRLMHHAKPGTIRMTLLVAAAMLAPGVIVAQDHPHYTNARTYIRTAQMLMRVPTQSNVQLTLKPADDELDAAVKEIDRAGVVDRSHAVDRPAINEKMEDVDRFRSIVTLLHTARNEIQQEADNTQAAWRSSALKNINAALESVHKAAIAARLDREINDF
jgi:hypothetical protein